MTRPRRKRVRLPVLGNNADHPVAQEWFPSAVARDKSGMVQRDKLGRLQVRVRPAPRYSPEMERDSEIDVEPLPYEAADGPACDIEAYRAHVRLRAARALVGTAPDPIPTPRTRAGCPSNRGELGCGAYRCRHHLWVAPPAGRPGLSRVPRDAANGWTLAVNGDFGDGDVHDRLALQPRWLELGTLPASCALDVADRGEPLQTEIVGRLLGRHRTLVGHEIRRALKRAASLGLDATDILRLFDPHAANENDRSPSRATRRKGRPGQK